MWLSKRGPYCVTYSSDLVIAPGGTQREFRYYRDIKPCRDLWPGTLPVPAPTGEPQGLTRVTRAEASEGAQNYAAIERATQVAQDRVMTYIAVNIGPTWTAEAAR